MQVLRTTIGITATSPYAIASTESELSRLRAQVALLQQEREELWWAVSHDELTGLANRRLFYTLAPLLLAEAPDGAAVLVLDLNGFKPINDRLGHAAGDTVLRTVADRIATCVGDHLVARLGGDEFAAVLTDADTRADDAWWQPTVQAMSASVREPIAVAGQHLRVTASIGVAVRHSDAAFSEVLRRADLAMYQAKVAGRPDVTWIAAGPSAPPGTALVG